MTINLPSGMPDISSSEWGSNKGSGLWKNGTIQTWFSPARPSTATCHFKSLVSLFPTCSYIYEHGI